MISIKLTVRKGGERRRERDEEGMREIDRWGSWWVIEGGRLKKREKRIQREGGVKQMFQNSVSTMTMKAQ